MKPVSLLLASLLFSSLVFAQNNMQYRALEKDEKVQLQFVFVTPQTTCLGEKFETPDKVLTLNCQDGARLRFQWLSAPLVVTQDGKLSFAGNALIQVYPNTKIENRVPSFTDTIHFVPSDLHYGVKVPDQPEMAVNVHVIAIGK